MSIVIQSFDSRVHIHLRVCAASLPLRHIASKANRNSHKRIAKLAAGPHRRV